MTVFVSLHPVRAGKVGGVETAVYNLCRGLAENGCDLTLGVRATQDLDPAFLARMATFPNVRLQPSSPLAARAGRVVAEEEFFLSSLGKGGLYLAVNYRVPLLASLVRGRKVGVIVHDLLPLARPRDVTLRKRLFFRFEVMRAAKRAQVMAFISAFSRDEFARLVARAPRGESLVVYNGVDWSELDAPAPSLATDGVLLLSVANDYPHKNLAVMYEGFLAARRERPELKLVFVGRPASHFGTVAEVGFLDRLPQAQDFEQLSAALSEHPAVRVSGLTRAQLGSLYRAADLVVHPSLYEGFGLPIVEAGGLGAPLLTTPLTAIPEVAPEGTRYVATPEDAEAWRDAIVATRPRGQGDKRGGGGAYRDRFSPRSVVAPLTAS